MLLTSGKWVITSTEEFDSWHDQLDEDTQLVIAGYVGQLSIDGPELGRPRVDTIEKSRHINMKELRFTYDKHIFRIFFAFNSRREGILIIGGDKRGNKRFYKEMIPVADDIFDMYK